MSAPVSGGSSTKRRIVELLRRRTRTVEDLAQALGITDNAVRAQITGLERDGLVRQAGVRRGFRKPSYAYTLGPSAESVFPKPYALALGTILSTAAEEWGPGAVETLLRASGERLGRQASAGAGTADRGAAVHQAAAAINQLGGLAEVEDANGSYVIHGYDCLFRSMLPDHPEICQLAQSLIATATGAPVAECCDRRATPQCRFEIRKPQPNEPGGDDEHRA